MLFLFLAPKIILTSVISLRYQYLQPLNCVQTTKIFNCVEMNGLFLKNKITNYSLTNNVYIYTNNHSTVCKQMTDVKLNC